MIPVRVSGTDLTSARGASSIELAIGVLIWVVALAVLATAYQITTSSDDVADAAGQAARAAALTAAPADAIRAASSTARTRLTVGSCEPTTVTVNVNVSEFRAGGIVTVTVSCRTDPPLGPKRTVSSTSDEALDRYRGGL